MWTLVKLVVSKGNEIESLIKAGLGLGSKAKSVILSITKVLTKLR